MDAARPLEGTTVGITADRKAAEQAELFVRRGATVVHGPTLATVPIASDHLEAETEAVIADPPDDLLVTTGAGLRAWVEAAAGRDRDGALLDALRPARLTTRGPKSSRAARALGLEPSMEPPSERLDDALALLLEAGVTGRRVVVQEHGEPTAWVTGALADAGAVVRPVRVYRWRLPDDPAPARALVVSAVERRVDVVTFTSAPAVANLFALADLDGLGPQLLEACNDGSVVPACVGPVCAEAARAEGVLDPVHPEVGRLGLLVRAVEQAVAARR